MKIPGGTDIPELRKKLGEVEEIAWGVTTDEGSSRVHFTNKSADIDPLSDSSSTISALVLLASISAGPNSK